MSAFFNSDINRERISNEQEISVLRQKIATNPENIALHKYFAKVLLETPSKTRQLEASNSLNRVLESKPEDIDAQILAIRINRLSNKTDVALYEAESLLEKFPNNPSILEEIGRLYYQKEYFVKSKSILKDTYQKFPNNQRIGRALSKVLLKLNEVDYSLEILNNLIENEPSNPKNIQSKINWLRRSEKFQEAIELGESFRKKFPMEFNRPMWSKDETYVPLAVNLANVYREYANKIIEDEKSEHLQIKIEGKKLTVIKNIPPESKKFFEKANDKYDELLFDVSVANDTETVIDTYSIIYHKTNCLLKLERFREALANAEEILQKRDEINTEFLIGKILFYLGRFDDALKYFEKIIIKKPRSMLLFKWVLYSHVGAGNFSTYQKMLNEYEDSRIFKKNKEKNNQYKEFERKDYSINPGTQYDNTRTVEDFFNSREGILQIKDSYFSKDYLNFLHDNVNFDKVKEIQILRHAMTYEGGRTFYNVCRKLPKKIQYFKEQHKKCIFAIKIHFENPFHDRYAIDEKEYWNVPAFDSIEKGSISDLTPLDNEKGNKIKSDEFKKLWNTGIELTTKNWAKIVIRLTKEIESEKMKVCSEIQKENNVKENNVKENNVKENNVKENNVKENNKPNELIRDKIPELVKESNSKLQIQESSDEELLIQIYPTIVKELEKYLEAEEIQNKFKKITEQHMKKPEIDVLKNKYIELRSESQKNNPINNLVDIIEIVYRIAEIKGITVEELEKIRKKKIVEYGAFKKNRFLVGEKSND